MPQKIKPAKPHPDFPLYAHASGRWAKKVRSVLQYFGPWADPQAALEKWLEQKDDLLAGRQAIPLLSVILSTNFFTARNFTARLTPRSFGDYNTTYGKIIDAFGRNRSVADLRPYDFERLRKTFAKTREPVRIWPEIASDFSRIREGRGNFISAGGRQRESSWFL
jgi:hypothetical protein